MTPLAAFLTAAVLATCPVSHVHYRSYPGVGAGLAGVPWIETSNATFYGHLFYWGATSWGRRRALGARIFTTVKPHPVHPKVLWIPRRASGVDRITIHGRRLDAPGSFTSRYPGASGGQFPSYVLVPRPGCWRVTVTSGRLSGSVVFAAVDNL